MSINVSNLLDRLVEKLVPLVGPVIANMVVGLIIREASLNLTEEQKAELQSNRVRALAARADEARRAAGDESL